MKLQLLTFALLGFITASPVFSQKYITKNASISFDSSVESFEKVAAKTNSASILIDTEKGNLASLLFVSSFTFENALMQEHFNENYMESSTYPKAKLSGSLKDFDSDKFLADKTWEGMFIGNITIKDKKEDIEIPVSLTMENEHISVLSNFELEPKVFGIKIPKIVENKIAPRVLVAVDGKLDRK